LRWTRSTAPADSQFNPVVVIASSFLDVVASFLEKELLVLLINYKLIVVHPHTECADILSILEVKVSDVSLVVDLELLLSVGSHLSVFVGFC